MQADQVQIGSIEILVDLTYGDHLVLFPTQVL